MKNERTLTPGSESDVRKHTLFPKFRAAAPAGLIALATVLGLFVWRLRSAGELPDLGDPFDVDLARKPVVVADGDNAYAAYAQARINLANVPDDAREAASKANEDALRWSTAPGAIRELHEKNRPALETWRKGSERPDALFHQPGEYSFDVLLGLLQEVWMHNAFAALEGSRLEEQGKMAEAWDWYRAMLRASRMVGRHAGLVERRCGAQMHDLASKRILRWAADPRVDARMLHRALDDALAADRLTAPISDALKLEYLATVRDLCEMKVFPLALPSLAGGLLDQYVPWSARRELQLIRINARNDIERSRRAVRFLFTNWLAQVDKPAAERAARKRCGDLYVYKFDRSVPRAARDLSPESISRAIDETLLARWLFRSEEHVPDVGETARGAWEGDGFFARERRRRSVLLVRLAAEIYRRENGEPPAKAGALLKGYLRELPEGISRDDVASPR